MAGKKQKLRLPNWRGPEKGAPPPRWGVPAAHRNEQSHAENERILSVLETAHSECSPNAARAALRWCAVCEIPMPRWLAMAVCEALEASDKGKPGEDVFGFGNKRALAQWRKTWLAARDRTIRESINHSFEWFKSRGYNISTAEIIKSQAHQRKMSVKAVEKIYYAPPKSPTETTKK